MCLEKTVREKKGREGGRESLYFTLQTHLLILKLKSLSTLLTVTSDILTLYTAPYSNSSVILILTLTILLILVAILQLLVGGDTSEQ